MGCGDGYDVVLADSLDEVSDSREDISITLTAEEEAAVDPLNENPPPGADPNAPPPDPAASEGDYLYDFPLETETRNADGTYTTQGIAGTNCLGRTDDAHRSDYDPTEAKAVVGVYKCDYEKHRIWIEGGLQRWVPYPGYWKNVKIVHGQEYNTRSVVRNAVYKCPTGAGFWYRSALWNATVVDKDGDVHKMLFSRYGTERFSKCIG